MSWVKKKEGMMVQQLGVRRMMSRGNDAEFRSLCENSRGRGSEIRG